MLKKTITFTNYDGQQETVDAYFNLSKTECVDLNLEYEADGGLVGHMKKLLGERENGQIRQKPAVDFIKLLIEKSYGERPADDPSQFIKEDDNGKSLFKRFSRTAAYDAYLYALLSGEESLDEFAESVLPQLDSAQRAEAEKMLKEEGFPDIIQLKPSQG